MNLDFIEFSDTNYDKIVVFIHGWRGNKTSFKSISSIMKIEKVKWLFPQAPYKMSNKNEEYSYFVNDNYALTSGNAGNVLVLLDGKIRGKIGKKGEIVESLIISSEFGN